MLDVCSVAARESYSIYVFIDARYMLDRFYIDNQAENIINELINLSSPEPYKKTFFLWPEGIIPNTYLDELKLYESLFIKN